MKKYLYCICLFSFPLFCIEKESCKNLQTAQIEVPYLQPSTKQFIPQNKKQKRLAIPPTTATSFEYQPKKESNFFPKKGSIRFNPSRGPRLEKNPFIASALSFAIPGLGHIYLEKPLQGAGYFTLSFACSMYAHYHLLENPLDGPLYLYPYQKQADILGFNSAFYSVYAAYRDAKMFHSGETACDHVPKDGIDSMVYAPFSPRIMAKPEVLGGIAGSLSLAVIASYIVKHDMHLLPRLDISEVFVLTPLSGFPIAIIEESFFRGVIQPTLIECTNPTIGISIASIIFGLCHLPNALLFNTKKHQDYYLVSMPIISTIGGYLGYLTYKNQSLQEAIAVHGWYDFILLTASIFSPGYLLKATCVEKPRHCCLSWDF